jgi:hypothetical protein
MAGELPWEPSRRDETGLGSFAGKVLGFGTFSWVGKVPETVKLLTFVVTGRPEDEGCGKGTRA